MIYEEHRLCCFSLRNVHNRNSLSPSSNEEDFMQLFICDIVYTSAHAQVRKYVC
jgi:hypothetical protein